MRRDPHSTLDGMTQGHHAAPQNVTVDGKVVTVRQISPTDEGVLYTMQISVSSGSCGADVGSSKRCFARI